MPLAIAIVPLNNAQLDLFDDPNLNAAYALSGHIAISFLSKSLFTSARPESLLLESLLVTFEGQCDYLAGSHSSARLCSISRELILDGPVELVNDLSQGANASQQWEAVFNIPVPGWLPASSLYGEQYRGCPTGTQYRLYAKAVVRDISPSPSQSTSILSSLLCGLFPSSSSRVVHANPQSVTISRAYPTPRYNASQRDLSLSPFPTVSYSVRTKDASRSNGVIPEEILSAMEVTLNVPEHVAIDRPIPVSLRIRLPQGVPTEQCRRMKILGFNIHMHQKETYRTSTFDYYQATCPLPPPTQQPPNVPLLSFNSLDHLYALGLISQAPQTPIVEEQEFSILPSDHNLTSYRLADDGMSIEPDTSVMFALSVKLNPDLPLDIPTSDPAERFASDGKIIRTSYDSPFLRVRHDLSVELLCSYHDDGAEAGADIIHKLRDTLRFTIPLHCVLPAPPPSLLHTRSTSNDSISESSSYTKQALKMPAYSQLFYPNGDPKEDLWDVVGEDLPLYSKLGDDQELGQGTPLLGSFD